MISYQRQDLAMAGSRISPVQHSENPSTDHFRGHIDNSVVRGENPLQPLTLSTCANRDGFAACFDSGAFNGPLSVNDQYQLTITVATVWAWWCDIFYQRKPFSSMQQNAKACGCRVGCVLASST